MTGSTCASGFASPPSARSAAQPRDRRLLYAICDEILILSRGQAVAWGTPSEITARNRPHLDLSLPVQSLRANARWEVVSAERDGAHLRLRAVGDAPPDARPVPPRPPMPTRS